MPRSLSQIYIHAVWAVKNREPLLLKGLRLKLMDHIFEKFKDHQLRMIAIGGVEDHLHCVFRLPSTLTVAQAIKDIKGESSRWINASQLLEGDFSWQEGYGAFSVSPQRIDHVKQYILNQEQHHQTVSYEEEMKIFNPQIG